jgi:hypothetical protein
MQVDLKRLTPVQFPRRKSNHGGLTLTHGICSVVAKCDTFSFRMDAPGSHMGMWPKRDPCERIFPPMNT